MNVTKRNGQTAEFDKQKIVKAINKAFVEIYGNESYDMKSLAEKIADTISRKRKDMTVEEIQDSVENYLMASKYKDVARAYIRYRYQKEKDRLLRDNLEARYERLNKLITGRDEESNKENSNKDTRIIPTMRDYIAGFTCRELATKVLLPKDIAEAHEQGLIHFHK